MSKKTRISTGCSVTNRLYTAVRDYVEKNHGSVVVMGGIALVEEGQSPDHFGIMVRCLGKKPEKITSNDSKPYGKA